jgi:hypothetical protein
LMYEARMSLRNQLRGPDPLNLRGSDQIRGSEIRGSGPLIGGLSVKDIRAIADVSMSINTPEAAKFVVDHAAALGDDREVLAKYLRHALKYAEGYEIESAAAFVRRQFAEDDFTQLELFKTLLDTAQERKIALGDATREWAARLVTTILRERVTAVDGWVMSPVEGAAPSMSPWTLQPRNSSDGDRKSMFLSSLPAGEPLTGVLRSPEFIVPSELKFFFAGHDGWPSSPPQKKNYVRLIDAASHAVLAEAKPPRKDLAQPVTWKLQSHAGAKAYLELTDGDTGTGYAWLAVGRFSPAVVPFPKSSPSASGQRMQTAAELAGAMKLTETRGELRTLASDRQATQDARVAAANTLVSLAGDDVAATLAPLINNPAEPVALREKFVAALADSQNDGARAALAGAIAAAPNRIQTAIAKSLAKSRAGGEALLATIDRGKAPARLLQDESLRQSMLAAGVPDLDARIKQLTRPVARPAPPDFPPLIAKCRARKKDLHDQLHRLPPDRRPGKTCRPAVRWHWQPRTGPPDRRRSRSESQRRSRVPLFDHHAQGWPNYHRAAKARRRRHPHLRRHHRQGIHRPEIRHHRATRIQGVAHDQ